MSLARWAWLIWSWWYSVWLGAITSLPTGINTCRDLAQWLLPLGLRLTWLWVFCRPGMERCFWVEIRGEEGYCLRRWCFSLLHCPHSKSYDPSDQVLLNSICQMDKLLDSSCMPSLTLHNFSAEMDEVSYRLPKFPQWAQEGVFLIIHHHYAPDWAPRHTFLSAWAPDLAERADPCTHRGSWQCSPDPWSSEKTHLLSGAGQWWWTLGCLSSTTAAAGFPSWCGPFTVHMSPELGQPLFLWLPLMKPGLYESSVRGCGGQRLHNFST